MGSNRADTHSRRRLAIIVACIGFGAVLVVGALIAARIAARPRAPQAVVLEASLDTAARDALSRALADYNGRQTRFAAELAADADPAKADLVLGPYAEGRVLWRSLGWRLWARQETLAKLEGAWRKQLILMLRSESYDLKGFLALLTEIKAAGLAPIILPTAAATISTGLRRYVEALGSDAPAALDPERAGGLVVKTLTLDSALEALRNGTAAFIIGNESIGGLLGRGPSLHPEGFPLPGSSATRGGWAIGRAEGFFLVPKGKEEKPSPGALDLVSYLTSRGTARTLGAQLPGFYYSWSAAPAEGAVPLIDGPARFIDPEK